MPDTSSAADDRARIDQFLARFGAERDLDLAPLDDDGVARIQRGSAQVSIHVVAEQGVLLLLSRVMPVPEDRREELYRRLLELSFVATGDAAFAINKQTNEIYLRCLRRLEGLDYEEFEDLVHTVATVADDWDDALRRDFSA
ncbi:MAG TPA: YbjN domain-containing protein [Kofleriaceae bacterium]|nr:YbjN domain-containing protein [Kofleriaceae bacterium]